MWKLFVSALGSVDNTLRFENRLRPAGDGVPEIYALPLLGDRVVLNIVDALICQYREKQTTLLHYSTTLTKSGHQRSRLPGCAFNSRA